MNEEELQKLIERNADLEEALSRANDFIEECVRSTLIKRTVYGFKMYLKSLDTSQLKQLSVEFREQGWY